MKPSIEVEILGQRYTISGEGEENYVKELARYVDGRMREIAKNSVNIPSTKLALLAAINITDELFKNKQDQKNKQSFVEQKTQNLIHAIDQAFSDLARAQKGPKYKYKEVPPLRKSKDLIDQIDQQFGDLKLY